MNWYLNALKQYTDFKGRARRKEYWMFALFNMIFLVIAIVIDSLLGFSFAPEIPYGYISTLYYLFIIIPTISIGVRRLHDIGKSGWWYLLAIVPIASIVLLVWSCTDSESGSNKWGENPKGIGNNGNIDQIGTE